MTVADETLSALAGVRVGETRVGKFQVEVAAAGHRFLADEPRAVGGLGSGPNPFQLLSAALGACTAMTCRLYADKKGWPLEAVIVSLEHIGKTATAKDRFIREISLEGPLDAAQRQRLLEIADHCPVHRTLVAGSDIETRLSQRAEQADENPELGHFEDMEEVCATC
jgi:putative redox protein